MFFCITKAGGGLHPHNGLCETANVTAQLCWSRANNYVQWFHLGNSLTLGSAPGYAKGHGGLSYLRSERRSWENWAETGIRKDMP